MADTVTSQTIADVSGQKTTMKFTNISDGSGETLVTKMDASALTYMTEDATKKISKLYWSINTQDPKGAVEIIFAGSGTSAAAPGISGTLAQLYQAYKDLNTGVNPPSALMKCILLNTADDPNYLPQLL